MNSQVSYEDIPAPRGWLVLAFLGVWLYLIAQILRAYPEQVGGATGASPEDVETVLAFLAGLGSILVLAGLIAALWRSNLAAGLSPAGVRGLVLGAAGVGVLVLFELAHLLDLAGIRGDPVTSLLQARAIGDVVGTGLAFAGLASLVVGLSQAAGLFARVSRQAALPKASDEST